MMKLVIKKSYCPACHRLVYPKQQANKVEVHLLCPRCGRQLYSWNGLRWNVSGRRPAAVK